MHGLIKSLQTPCKLCVIIPTVEQKEEAPSSYTICFGPAVNKLQRHYGKQSLLPQLPILLTPRRGEERPKEETGEKELGYGKEEGETRTEKTDT